MFGYTRDISALMDASDILVTKPGGLTASEALSGIPMILISPLPGQEQRNSRYLTSCGAAVLAKKSRDVKNLVRQLILHPAQRAQLSEKALAISAPDAASNTAREIAALLI